MGKENLNIQQEIIHTREDFLNELSDKNKTKLSYNLPFDQKTYQVFHNHRSDSLYDEEKERLNKYIKKQLETLIGERLNTLLSIHRYDIKDGEMFGENQHEPFLKTIIRGKEYRAHHGSQDLEREEAEVKGFSEIQKTLCDEKASIGSMAISISPPSGIYKHNFHDIFTLWEDESGRYVESRRYSSSLSNSEYLEKIKKIAPSRPLPLRAEPSYFLSDPIIIPSNSRFNSPEEIHAFFHKEHSYIDEKDFKKIMDSCAFLVGNYINNLCNDPFDTKAIGRSFDAILNGADEVAEGLERKDKEGLFLIYPEDDTKMYGRRDLLRLESQQVREVMTGCGSSSGSGVEKDPFNVSEFGSLTDDYGDREFPCPSCGRTNVRPKNELVSRCQHCGSDAVSCKDKKGGEKGKIINFPQKQKEDRREEGKGKKAA